MFPTFSRLILPPYFQKNLTILLSVLIYLSTLILHSFYGLSVVTFTQDQARDVALMEQFAAKNVTFISYGPKASVGSFYLAPFYYQLHYWVSLTTQHQPLAMQWVVILVESGTPVLLFLILKAYLRRSTAAAIALCYAIAPLPMIFATAAWNPNMIPFFTSLALLCFMTYVRSNLRWPLILGTLSVSIAGHLHYQAALLLPFVGLFGLYTLLKDRKTFWYWLAGGILSGVLLLPYFLTELQTGWPNSLSLYHYFTGEHSRYFDRISKPAFVLSFIPGFLERLLIGNNFPGLWIGRLVTVLGGACLAWAAIKNKRNERWLLIYFVVLVLSLRLYKGDKLDYYMSSLFIFPFVLLGFLVERFKLLGAGVALFVVLTAATTVIAIPKQDQLATIIQTVGQLSAVSPTRDVSLIFHEDNNTNLFLYAVPRHTELRLKKSGQSIIDVCARDKRCVLPPKPLCRESRSATYSNLLKLDGSYQYQGTYVLNQQFKVVVGTVSARPRAADYSQYTPHSTTYGSDILEGELP